jgi:molecular chaperone HscA
MPSIREKIAENFNVPIITDLNPDEIVVHGAALQAASLMGDGDSLLLDVTPLSLGIETAGGLVEKIISRNTSIPTAQAQEFTTFKDGQTAMDIHILQGERETVENCRSLAKFRLIDIPPMPAGGAKITVTYTIDADGLLTVSAQEETTGHTQQVEVNPSYGLEEDKILEMIKSSFEHAQEDVTSRSIKETQTELSHLVEACDKALKIDSELLTEEEISSLYTVLEQAKKELNNNSLSEIQNITASLEESFSGFAEKRMNNTLKESIVGLPVSKFE